MVRLSSSSPCTRDADEDVVYRMNVTGQRWGSESRRLTDTGTDTVSRSALNWWNGRGHGKGLTNIMDCHSKPGAGTGTYRRPQNTPPLPLNCHGHGNSGLGRRSGRLPWAPGSRGTAPAGRRGWGHRAQRRKWKAGRRRWKGSRGWVKVT